MTGELTGRTAVVTGGSRGIGLAVAAALLERGANVVLTSRKRESADAAAATLSSDRAAGYAAYAADDEAAAGSLHARSGRRVAVIGHSRGGHFARAVAARRPDLVSHVVSLGADLQAMFHCSVTTLAAVELTRRVLLTTGRARRPECVTYNCPCAFTAAFGAPFPQDRVGLTSIYSRSDGVVRWQAQLVPYADCVEVTGSHMGLILNRESYRVIAHALAASELTP